MNYFTLWVQYNGTRYCGWQIQNNQKTIQGELNRVLRRISKGEEVRSIGSGRTDAGVHAISQVVRIEIPLDIPPENLKKGLNSLLPNDISIDHCDKTTESFHPIFSAKSKTYEYFFSDEFIPTQFKDLVAPCPQHLDFELMKKGVQLFVGKHDFCNFYTKGSKVKSTIRTILNCDLAFRDYNAPWSHDWRGAWCFSVEGEGFLKQMVRLMVGSLWALGKGSLGLEQLQLYLEEKQERRPGIVAPAQGLYLRSVKYK